MDMLETLLGNSAPPLVNGNRGNGGNDYKTQIDSQLSRLISNKIPIDQLRNYKQKNDKIVSGLNEIIGIIDESKQHFGDFQRKMTLLQQKNSLGQQTIRDATRFVGQQQQIGQACSEQNRIIIECETEKRKLQMELNTKLENISKKDGDIKMLTQRIEELQKTQTTNVSSMNSANEELIRYNQSLVEKIKRVADSQSEIINELDNDLAKGTDVDSKMINLKEKLIDLVDSIDDENNKMGTPLVHRNGRFPRPARQPPQIPQGQPMNRLGEQIVWKAGPMPFGNGKFQGGKRRKTKKRSKKGGKVKKNMRINNNRTRK